MRRALIRPRSLIPARGVSNLSHLLGTICGLIYGALSAASMIPLSFSDKTAALTGAFLNRFAIGFVIGGARLPVPQWAQGLIFGVLLSLPDAIITKAYAPILILGQSVVLSLGSLSASGASNLNNFQA